MSLVDGVGLRFGSLGVTGGHPRHHRHHRIRRAPAAGGDQRRSPPPVESTPPPPVEMTPTEINLADYGFDDEYGAPDDLVDDNDFHVAHVAGTSAGRPPRDDEGNPPSEGTVPRVDSRRSRGDKSGEGRRRRRTEGRAAARRRERDGGGGGVEGAAGGVGGARGEKVVRRRETSSFAAVGETESAPTAVWQDPPGLRAATRRRETHRARRAEGGRLGITAAEGEDAAGAALFRFGGGDPSPAWSESARSVVVRR